MSEFLHLQRHFTYNEFSIQMQIRLIAHLALLASYKIRHLTLHSVINYIILRRVAFKKSKSVQADRHENRVYQIS